MSFGRDYFLPMPQPDWTMACKGMAECAYSAGLGVQLLRRLCVPRRQGSQLVAVREPAAPVGCGRRLLERTLVPFVTGPYCDINPLYLAYITLRVQL